MKIEVVFVLIAAIIFSTMEVGLKIVGQTMGPFQVTFYRFLIGGLFLLPFALRSLKQKDIGMSKKDFLYYIFLGTLNTVVTMGIFQISLQSVKASTAAVLLCINPMFTILLSHFMTDDKLNKRKVIALALSLIGILFILNLNNMTHELKGMLLVIIAAFFFALYSVAGVKQVKKYGGIAHTSISFLLGAAVLFVLLILFRQPLMEGITLTIIPALLYLGIVVAGIGYLAYFSAMERSSASLASITFFIKPAIAPFIAVITLGEEIAFNTIIGIIFILVGSFISLQLDQYFVPLINKKKENYKND
ncbi:MAG: EamA family transporter [Peptostreptococcales bacterium]